MVRSLTPVPVVNAPQGTALAVAQSPHPAPAPHGLSEGGTLWSAAYNAGAAMVERLDQMAYHRREQTLLRARETLASVELDQLRMRAYANLEAQRQRVLLEYANLTPEQKLHPSVQQHAREWQRTWDQEAARIERGHPTSAPTIQGRWV